TCTHALNKRLTARWAGDFRNHGRRPAVFALAGFDVLAFRVARAAEKLAAALAAEAHDERLAALRALLVRLLPLHRLHLGLGDFQRLLEWFPKLGQDLLAAYLARFDLIELAFHVTGELQVHHARKMLDQQICDHLTQFSCVEPALALIDIAAF